MNRNSHPDFTGNSQISLQVADWAKNWAETFRREAWQQPATEITNEPLVGELLDETQSQLSSR